MRKALKITRGIIVALVVILATAWIVFQIPGAQTFLTKRIASSLEDRLGGRIEFSSIHLKPFNVVILKDFRLIDENPPVTLSREILDTVASARSVMASFSLGGLLKKEGIHLRKVSVEEGSFTLVNGPEGNNLKRVFPASREKTGEAGKEMGDIFDAGRVQVDGFRFRLVNLKKGHKPKEYGINWADMDVYVKTLRAHNLSLSRGYMRGEVDGLEAYEKSGYHIASLAGKTTVGGGKTLIEDLRLSDDWSEISMSEFSMGYAGIQSFKRFTDEVRLTGDIRNSKLDFRSLSYFAPALKDMSVKLDIRKADVDGPVSDLGIDGIDFTESRSGVRGHAEGRLTGLPKIGDTVFDFKIHELSFTSEGLGTFVNGFAPSARLALGRFAPGDDLEFEGDVKGTLNNLGVNGEARSTSNGGITTDLRLHDLIISGSPKRFSGAVATNALNIGRIAGVDKIGEVTMRGVMDASLGKGGINLKIDSLFIDKLRALDYDYSNIMAAGTFSDKAFDGRLICDDPNLNLLFQGIFTLSDKTSNGLYKFYADVGYADLQALGIDKRRVSKVAGRINANYMTVKGIEMIGDLDIMDLNLENSLGKHDVGDIRIASHSGNGIHRVNLDSGFANGSFVGTKPVTGIAGDLRELTLLKELPLLCEDTLKTWKSDKYDVRLDIHDIRDVLSFAMPGLYIADSSQVRLSVSDLGEVKASVKSSRIALGKNYLRNIDLAFDNKGGSLNGAMTGSELALGGMVFRNDHLSIFASDNHIGLGYSFDNNGDFADKGEIYLSGELGRSAEGEPLVYGHTLPSSIWINDQEWTMSQSDISLLGKNLVIDNLSASSGGQSIKVDGGFSKTRPDTLVVNLVKFDMGIANILLGKNLGISGLATGRSTLSSPWETNAGLTAALSCDSVKVGGFDAGTLSVNCGMVGDGRLDILASNRINGAKTFDINGFYATKDKGLDIVADLDGLEAGYISPLLSSVFSETRGDISGKVRINGKTDDLCLSGEDTRFDNVLLRVAFTNVPYYADGSFKVDNEGLHLDGISVKDRFDGTGVISGGILFNHLKDIRMDTRIKMSGMEAVNMEPSSGQPIYGNVFATGDVSIKGPFNAIRLDVDARTDKSGAIHIPIDKASSDANTNLLTFKEPEKEVYVDPYDVMMNRLVSESKKENDFGMHLKIAANQRTEAYVEIDRLSGNALNGRGQGNIDIVVRPAADLFSINGDYTLESGRFHFNALDITQKDFTLSQGSSIRFNGDVMDSDLDIDGIYTTKASIATLIADTTSVSTRKTVNCGIGISGKVREPLLSFSIDVPDIDPTTKAKVESALNTEDKVQRQFLSLLISGGFMPEEQSGIVNNTTNLYSNLAEIMAGQLNNILQKLDIPLDFGLNYQSSVTGSNIFDVAVSTQLFNNRVIVNGNVGNREYGNSSREDVVGDVDIEIKLDKPGQVRLKLFSHSADDYTNFLDNSQRNGVGMTYQKEFSTFPELIRSIFSSRKRRSERANAPVPEKEYKRVEITN
ncbi:MAG: translocation/assembly module TamB domain-containing protein [Bacteroidales bacterium]|nr:translocation/assembly module TamB domain-containing protein [Bacteroidales bacterium]